MKRASSISFGILILIVVLFTGCAGQGASASTVPGGSYHSALKTDYKDALDVEGQLALGTLELENTANQVTQDEATALLPPWEALQANAAKSTVERQALLEQIERTMSRAQITAIAAMRLTQADVQTWLQSQGASSAAGRGRGQQGGAPGASPRGGAQIGSAAGQTSIFLLRPVIALLTVRSGQGAAQPSSVTPMVEPTRRAIQTRGVPERSTATPTPAPTSTPIQAAEPATSTPLPAPNPTASVPANTPEPASALAPAVAPAPDPPGVLVSAAAAVPALTWLTDTDPGPPFTVEISANRATQDPLVEKSYAYLVTGIVRNDSDRTFALDRINVTFYDANGFRGYFSRFSNRRTGGEWIWFGATQADFGCVLLAPGEACPFSVEITAQDIVSFLVHPDAAPTERESAPVALSGLNVTRDPPDYVRITGMATNTNPFEVKNVIVCGVLLDGGGQIVSLGSSYVLREAIQPGATVQFDLRIPYKPYASYEFYTQAERDWK